tara:strand:- start:11143 stop:11688 length:546 start_codon:yes stop_codon:yes gene_type:complete
MTALYTTQNSLLLDNLLKFYKEDSRLDTMLGIINGDSKISLRIVDWFATNYAKQRFTVYSLNNGSRFKVYNDYKLKLRAYSKKRFDPFCRWERIIIPYKDNNSIQTTIGQLNFFKWALENEVIKFIENHYSDIEKDMNNRNSTSKRRSINITKTRKKREELSISATKSVKQETVEVVLKFN